MSVRKRPINLTQPLNGTKKLNSRIPRDENNENSKNNCDFKSEISLALLKIFFLESNRKRFVYFSYVAKLLRIEL